MSRIASYVKEISVSIRSAFYIDGFNFYHAVADLNENFLKWCNLWQLAEILIPSRSERLVKVVFCTAYYPGDERKRWRHNEFRKALEIVGAECVWGHYVHEPKQCFDCGSEWNKPTEKETDINVALCLYRDAMERAYDKAYFLTADSDQAATARMFRQSFPDKELISVAPPGRNFSSHIVKHTHGRIAINKDHLDRCVFPQTVIDPIGRRPAAKRPREYDPPSWWVHPDNRP